MLPDKDMVTTGCPLLPLLVTLIALQGHFNYWGQVPISQIISVYCWRIQNHTWAVVYCCMQTIKRNCQEGYAVNLWTSANIL